MLRSLQIFDQIAHCGSHASGRLDLMWIGARNAARRGLDLGVAAGGGCDVAHLLTSRSSTRLSQTRLNDWRRLPNLGSSQAVGPWRVTRPVGKEVGSGLVVAFLRAGDDRVRLGLQLSTLAPMRPRNRCAHRRCPAAATAHHHRLRVNGKCVSARPRTKANFAFSRTGDLVIDQLPANG